MRFDALSKSVCRPFARFNAGSPVKDNQYSGVAVIQIGPAKGHFAVLQNGVPMNYDSANPEHTKLTPLQIWIDSKTLESVARCGNEAGTVKCKLDHGGTVKDIVGAYSGFVVEGDTVRANLALMQSSPHREYVRELFDSLSESVGNSIDFSYRYEIIEGKAFVRCEKLNSVDIVDSPAATSGLFEENNNPDTHMPLSKDDLEEVRKVCEITFTAGMTAALQPLTAQLAAVSKRFEEGEEKKEPEGEEKKEEKTSEDEFTARVSKAVMAELTKVMPRVPVVKLSQPPAEEKGDYDAVATKLASSGMKAGEVIRFMAERHPTLYNAKFGGAK